MKLCHEIVHAVSFISNLICSLYFFQPIVAPLGKQCVAVEGYWVSQGDLEPTLDPSYILTPSVKLNLRDLARVVSAG